MKCFILMTMLASASALAQDDLLTEWVQHESITGVNSPGENAKAHLQGHHKMSEQGAEQYITYVKHGKQKIKEYEVEWLKAVCAKAEYWKTAGPESLAS